MTPLLDFNQPFLIKTAEIVLFPRYDCKVILVFKEQLNSLKHKGNNKKNNKHDETDKEHKIEKHATGRGLANRNNTESPDP